MFDRSKDCRSPGVSVYASMWNDPGKLCIRRWGVNSRAAMPHASYSLSRVYGVLWRWEADYRQAKFGRGYALTRAGARWRARGWLRAQRPSEAQPEPTPKPTEAERIAAE